MSNSGGDGHVQGEVLGQSNILRIGDYLKKSAIDEAAPDDLVEQMLAEYEDLADDDLVEHWEDLEVDQENTTDIIKGIFSELKLLKESTQKMKFLVSEIKKSLIE